MAGIGQFEHFIGYVVAREDAQNLGRVKVKALGYHDMDSSVINHEDLPWAPVVDGTYGAVSVVPLVGEWVLGAFLDGREAQHPIVLGRIPGYNSQAPSGTEGNGSTDVPVNVDDFGKLPLHSAMIGEGLEDLDGLVVANTATRKKEGDLIDAAERQHTEETAAIPERDLDNRVFSSRDDQSYVLLTEGDDGLIQIMHHTGTVIQFNEDGDMLIKTSAGHQNMVAGGMVEQIDGDVNTIVGQDYTLKVDNNGRMYFRNDLDIECENFSLTVRGDTSINTRGSTTHRTEGPMFINSGDNMNILTESKLKIQSIDLTTLESSNNGIYLYATGGNNRIDMTSGSLKVTTEVKPNQAVEDIQVEADTHHLGSIDIQSANNIRIETKGAPAESSPDSQEIDDSAGFFDIKSSAGMRIATAGDNLNIHSEKQLHVNAMEKIAIKSSNEDIYMSSKQQMKISSRNSTMDLQSKQDMRIGTNANGHLDASNWYIDDYVYMAGGGATAYNEPTGTYTENLAPAAITAVIASTTRKNEDTELENTGDPDIVLTLKPTLDDIPKAQGEGGYKVVNTNPAIPNPGNTNPQGTIGGES